MNLIKGKRLGREVYIFALAIVAFEPHPDHPDTRTKFYCTDGKEYVLDIPIEEVLKQIEGKE